MKERATFGKEMSSLNMGSINIWVDMGIIRFIAPKVSRRIGQDR
jgi:hypothetical protein